MDSATENAAAAPASSPGAILATERERQGLARADIAQRLHMSVSQIEALESGDYARLPRGTFLRGFARNYARAVVLRDTVYTVGGSLQPGHSHSSLGSTVVESLRR